MAKGQLRSNREKKKPKQPKQPAAIPSSARANQGRPIVPVPEKKK